MEPKYLTIDDVCALYQIGPQTFWRIRRKLQGKKGQIRRLGTRKSPRFDPDNVRRAMLIIGDYSPSGASPAQTQDNLIPENVK